MSITAITRDWGDSVQIVRIVSTDTLSAVSAANYILNQAANISLANNGAFSWLATDFVLVAASNGWGLFSISANFNSLTAFSLSTTVVGAPVVIGDFAVFQSTSGNIEDLGYLPSNAAKTTVVMASAAVTANHIAVFTDTAGTIDDDASTAINLGSIQAGASGSAGTLISFPGTASEGSLIVAAVNNAGGNFNTTISNAASVGQAQVVSIPDGGAASSNFIISNSAGTQSIASGSLAVSQGSISAGSSGHAGTVSSFPGTASKGSLILAAVNNTGNTNTTISNAAMGQASVISIPDPGVATSNFVLSQSNAPTNNVAFTKVITAGEAALATAGKVVVQAHTSASSQFAVLDIKVLTSTGLSGGGGNRLLALSDGTIVYNNAGITAALLGTPIFTIWGGTGNPVAVGAAQVSTAGADIYLQYSGGTTDYTTGSVQVAITLVQVTA